MNYGAVCYGAVRISIWCVCTHLMEQTCCVFTLSFLYGVKYFSPFELDYTTLI